MFFFFTFEIDNDGVNSIMNAIRNINPKDFENSESIRRHCCTLLNMCSLDSFFEPFLEAEGIENLSWLYSIENEKYEEFHEIINTIYAILRVHRNFFFVVVFLFLFFFQSSNNAFQQ